VLAIEQTVLDNHGATGGCMRCWGNNEGKKPCSLELHLGSRELAERGGDRTLGARRHAGCARSGELGQAPQGRTCIGKYPH